MTTCRHHWIVELPSGKDELDATCKLCGAARTFPASLHEYEILRGVACNGSTARQLERIRNAARRGGIRGGETMKSRSLKRKAAPSSS